MSDQAETVTMEVPTQPLPMPVPTPAPPAEFSGKPGDFAKDMALLAAQAAQQNPQTQTPSAPEQTSTVQPEQPATAPATPVPEKFKAPDGGIDEAKVQKSALHAEEALRKFTEIERQLRQKQNEVAALKQGAPVPVTPAVVPTNVQYAPFEIQVAQDLIQAHAEAGIQLPPAQALAQARVNVKLMEAKYSAEASMTESLRQRIEDQDRRRELEAIAKYDPGVFSPEGIEALSKIRQENPWINQAPNPWQAAHDLHVANQAKTQRLNGQVTPNPTGQTAKAPPTPVGPAPRVSVQPTGPDFANMSQDQITAHVRTLSPEAEKAFWASRGLRFR